MATSYLKRPFTLMAMAACVSGCLLDPDLQECIDVQLGISTCPSACTVYCEEMLDVCPETFATFAQCMDQCEVEPVAGQEIGEFGAETGNTLSCRQTQLAEGGGEAACREASLVDTNVCQDTQCGDYCDVMLRACPDAYTNSSDCLDTCLLIPEEFGANANSVQCRLEFANIADTIEASQCEFAGRSGGGICGTKCEAYCSFVMQTCTGELAQYEDMEECMHVCSFLPDGEVGDFAVDADSVECRAYHGSSPAFRGPATHCKHVQVYNDEFCALGDGGLDWVCIPYCDIALRFCPGRYADAAECEADCLTFPETIAAATDPTATADLFPQGAAQDCRQD